MLKKLFLLFVVLLLFSPLFAQADEDLPIISVLDFSVNNVSESDMNSIINLLSSALFRTGAFTVIDVSQRAAILSEMEFSNSGCSDESCQLEIGKLLSAEMIVVGDLAQVGSRFLFTAKLLETETGRTLFTADGVYGDLDELIDDLFPFAERLAFGDEAEEPAASPDVVQHVEPEQAAPNENPIQDINQPVVASSERSGPDGRKIAAFTTLTLGVIGGGVGGYLVYDALEYNSTYVSPALDSYNNASQGSDFDALRDVYEEYFDQFQSKAIVAGGIAGGGLLFLGVSALLFLAPEKVKDNTAVAVFTDPAAHTTTLTFHVSL